RSSASPRASDGARLRPAQAPPRSVRCSARGPGPMRIAIAANGTRGDIHPLLALAAGLARRGHEVVFRGPPDFADEARAEGVELRPVGTSVRAYLAERPALLHGGALPSLPAGQRYVEAQLEPQLRDLARAIDRADWVLAGGAQFTASSVAELREARFRMIAYCPSLLRSRWQTPFAVPRAELPPWANRVAWRWLE